MLTYPKDSNQTSGQQLHLQPGSRYLWDNASLVLLETRSSRLLPYLLSDVASAVQMPAADLV